MAKVALKYIGPSALIEVGRETVKRGETFVLDGDDAEELAAGLLAQGCSFPAVLDGDGNPTVDAAGNVVTERVEVTPQFKKTRAPRSADGGGGNE